MSDNEFIAARLARVAKAAGVDMPAGDHDFIAGTAGSILGTIARKLEVQAGALLSQEDRVQIEMGAMALDRAAKRSAKKGRPVLEHIQRCDAARLRAIAERIQQRAPTAAAQPEQASGMVLAPHFRGYAHLGIGAYVLNHSAAGEVPELSISVATEAQKAGRAVGDLRDNEPGELVQAEDIAVRLRFDNAAGLDALEQQLGFVRTVHFPESLAQPDANIRGPLTDEQRNECRTQPDQASRYKAQRDSLLEFIKNADVSSGVCCCGDDMAAHSAEHSSVDMWDHSVRCFVEEIEASDRATPASTEAAQPEQAAMAAALNAFTFAMDDTRGCLDTEDTQLRSAAVKRLAGAEAKARAALAIPASTAASEQPTLIQALETGNERESPNWFDIKASEVVMYTEEGYKVRKLYEHADSIRAASEQQASVSDERPIPPVLSDEQRAEATERYGTGVLPWSCRIPPNQSARVIADAMQDELNELRPLVKLARAALSGRATSPDLASIKTWVQRFQDMDSRDKHCHSGESLACAKAKDAEIDDLRAALAAATKDDK